MKRMWLWLLGVFGACGLLLATGALWQGENAAGAEGVPKWEVLNKTATGGFIVALARDLQGNIWVGTEDKGVFRYEPRAEEGMQWTQFNAKNGLGDDNAYAIASDKLGRVWVGTLNHGVSVFNGEDWQTYDVLDGPIGERMFAIATCPTDGDVWLATSAGLTRYSLKNDSWTPITRLDGLPTDLANALAFDAQGNVYVGTQCDGIALAKAADNYKTWTIEAGPAQLPLMPTGPGLATGSINGLLVARKGHVYAATSAGLGLSKDRGKTWTHLRGRDYVAKVKGHWGGPPQSWREPPKEVMDTLLPEDYVTCVAEDDAGLIWLGFRQHGYVALDPQSYRPVFRGTKKSEELPDDYVSAILPMADFRPWLTTFGAGSGRAKQALKAPNFNGNAPAPAMPVKAKPPALPTPAKPPSLAEINAILRDLTKVPDDKSKQTVILPLTDDWRTQGSWIDRHGNYAGVLCAMAGGGADVPAGYRAAYTDWQRWIGRNCAKGDQIRHWVHWITTDNPRSLQNPLLGGRKQSEWDDHGETYPMSQDGPHVYGSMIVPKGRYILSLYFFNKDGHDGSNRFRDYLAEVRPTPMTRAAFNRLGQPQVEAEAQFEKATQAAHSRVGHFWGGVYKRFYLDMPEKNIFSVRVNRNHSFNAIMSAMFLDPVNGQLPFASGNLPGPRESRWYGSIDKEPRDDPEASLRLLDKLLCLRDANGPWYARHARRYQMPLLRRMLREDDKKECLAARIEISKDYPNLREDVASCLNDLQLFDRRDSVYYGDRHAVTYRWQMHTKHGFGKWTWENKEFDAFVEQMRGKHSW